jgi:hypothetical protein
MTPADLLEAGADYIDANGWWDGAPGNDAVGPSTCMVLSLSMTIKSLVADEDDAIAPWESALDVLHGHLGLARDAWLDKLFAWNDSHSHIEVVEVMRKAAQEWRNDH